MFINCYFNIWNFSTQVQMCKKQWHLSMMQNPSAWFGDPDYFSQDQLKDSIIFQVLKWITCKESFLNIFPLQQASAWLQLVSITNNWPMMVKLTSIIGKKSYYFVCWHNLKQSVNICHQFLQYFILYQLWIVDLKHVSEL